eukprot:PRCOL_00004308-RA
MRLRALRGEATLCEALACEVREISGFDRCMVYRLHADMHGEVCAEARRAESVPSFLHLHWPATDLPQVNRRLLTKHPAPRLLADVNDTPSPVLQCAEGDLASAFGCRQALLAGSQIRGTIGCHKEYLNNMGVRGTLVVPLIIAAAAADSADDAHEDIGGSSSAGGGKPALRMWGMVVCHNISPRFVPLHTRVCLSMIAQIFTQRLEHELEIARLSTADRNARANSRLVELIIADNPRQKATEVLSGSLHTLREAVPFDADGVFVLDSSCTVIACEGAAESGRIEAARVARWIKSSGKLHEDAQHPGVFVCDSLEVAGYAALAAAQAVAGGIAGVVAIELPAGVTGTDGHNGASALEEGACSDPEIAESGGSAVGSPKGRRAIGGMIIWTRAELLQDIKWAGARGDSRDVVVIDHDDGAGDDDVKGAPRLGPRSSFAVVLEQLRGTCELWPRIAARGAGALVAVLRDAVEAATGSLLRAGIASVLNRSRLSDMGELEKVAAELSLLIDRAPMACMTVSANGEICTWNRWLQQSTGLYADAVIGTPLVSCLEGGPASPLAAALSSTLDSASDGEGVGTAEAHGVAFAIMGTTASGESCILRLIGDVVAAPAVVLAKEISAAIASTEQPGFLENMQSPVLCLDRNLRVTLWNHAMEVVTGGIASREVVGKLFLEEVIGTGAGGASCMQVATKQLFPLELALIRATRAEGSSQAASGALAEADVRTTVMCRGRALECVLSVRPAAERDGAPGEGGCLIYLQDQSMLRALEKAEAVRMAAEAAVRAKSNTISFLCHEIRNPLNGIVAATEFMRSGSSMLGEEMGELLQTTESCTRQLRRVVDDVLDATAIEQGKFKLNSQAFDLQAAISDCLQGVRPAASAKGLRLGLDVGGLRGLRHVVGDNVRLTQMISNIVWNAVKYTPAGQIELHAECTRATLPHDAPAGTPSARHRSGGASGDRGQGQVAGPAFGDLSLADTQGLDIAGGSNDSNSRDGGGSRVLVSIAVVDTGVGIAPEDCEKLFKRFELASSNVSKFGSTGLGLYYARTIARCLGGDISVESVLGAGSIFTCTVPFRIAPSARGDALVRSERPSSPIPRGLFEFMATGVPSECRMESAVHTIRGGDGTANARAAASESTAKSIVSGASARAQAPSASARAPPELSTPEGASAPANVIAPARGEQSTDGAASGKAGAVPKEALRVLICDDEHTNVRILQMALRKAAKSQGSPSPHIETAMNGKDALKLLRTSSFDIALLDEVMPGLYGTDVTQKLRAVEAEARAHQEVLNVSSFDPPRRLPVVLVTANSMPDDARTYARKGVDFLCAKPIPVRTLLGSLESIVHAAALGEVPGTDELPGLVRLEVTDSNGTERARPGDGLRDGERKRARPCDGGSDEPAHAQPAQKRASVAAPDSGDVAALREENAALRRRLEELEKGLH